MSDFNLTQYFLEGSTSCFLDKKIVDPLLEHVRKETFIPTEGSLWFNTKYVSWDKSKGTLDRAGHFNEVPSYLKDAAGELAQSDYFQWFTRIYGQFTQRTVFLHKWTRGDELGWFLRPSLGVFIHNVLVLSHDLHSDDEGGQLYVGMCDSDPDGKPIEKTELDIASHVPAHGLLLSLYSMNPNVLLRISQLKTDKEFYTIHFGFGYVENTIMRG